MNTLQLFEKNKEYDIMETGQLVKEQSWVPGMGVALAAISQPRYGLEIPCSWGWPPFLSFPESGISLHGIHVGLFLLRAYEFIAPLSQVCVEINIFNACMR